MYRHRHRGRFVRTFFSCTTCYIYVCRTPLHLARHLKMSLDGLNSNSENQAFNISINMSHICLNDFTVQDFRDLMQVVRKGSQNSEKRYDRRVQGHFRNFTSIVWRSGQLESLKARRNEDTGKNGTSIRATVKEL